MWIQSMDLHPPKKKEKKNNKQKQKQQQQQQQQQHTPHNSKLNRAKFSTC